jgi:cytochrome c551/c552
MRGRLAGCLLLATVALSVAARAEEPAGRDHGCQNCHHAERIGAPPSMKRLVEKYGDRRDDVELLRSKAAKLRAQDVHAHQMLTEEQMIEALRWIGAGAH